MLCSTIGICLCTIRGFAVLLGISKHLVEKNGRMEGRYVILFLGGDG